MHAGLLGQGRLPVSHARQAVQSVRRRLHADKRTSVAVAVALPALLGGVSARTVRQPASRQAVPSMRSAYAGSPRQRQVLPGASVRRAREEMPWLRSYVASAQLGGVSIAHAMQAVLVGSSQAIPPCCISRPAQASPLRRLRRADRRRAAVRQVLPRALVHRAMVEAVAKAQG